MNPDDAASQATWRYWGEERSAEAIHGVYLKKVRYHRPSRSVLGTSPSSSSSREGENGEEEDSISHLEWETVRVRQVKAGTLPALVAALASEEGELESTYVNVFLATYRAFASQEEVLALLLQRFEDLGSGSVHGSQQALPESIRLLHRKTLVLALHVWLDSYPEDFREPPSHAGLQRLKEFCARRLPGSELEVKVSHRLEKWRREELTFAGRGLLASSLFEQDKVQVNGHVPEGSEPWSILEVEPRSLAEQLTWADAEVFHQLVPHQCLGVSWARGGEKGRATKAPSVLATIQQFNAVSRRLVASLVGGGVGGSPPVSLAARARILVHWVDVAQELRLLKNFSSLKAIVAGLQAHPVFRLRRIWQLLPADKFELFEELARIFSEENNREAQRELLVREGTAKFAATVGHKDRQLQKALQRRRQDEGASACHGTVPYLGTFLTDLTMLDAAVPDMLPGGLINFDKRRREFEVLAQIRLLQGAANAYRITADFRIQRWFRALPVYSDKEAYALSLSIEPSSSSPCPVGMALSGGSGGGKEVTRSKPRLGHRKTDSLASTNSSSSSSHFYCDLDSLLAPPANSEDGSGSGKVTGSHRVSRLSSSSSCSSLPSLDTSRGTSSETTPFRLPDFYVIRVHVAPPPPAESESAGESTPSAVKGQVLYKSILLGNNERTAQVLQNAMGKLGLDGRPEDFELVQMLPDGAELVLPPGANVYYAVNTAYDMHFALRPKRTLPAHPPAQASLCGSPSPTSSSESFSENSFGAPNANAVPLPAASMAAPPPQKHRLLPLRLETPLKFALPHSH